MSVAPGVVWGPRSGGCDSAVVVTATTHMMLSGFVEVIIDGGCR